MSEDKTIEELREALRCEDPKKFLGLLGFRGRATLRGVMQSLRWRGLVLTIRPVTREAFRRNQTPKL